MELTEDLVTNGAGVMEEGNKDGGNGWKLSREENAHVFQKGKSRG